MADLRMNLEVLKQLDLEITQIWLDFRSVKPMRDDLSQAVGVYEGSDADGLAKRVEDFSKGWDIRRGEIVDTLEATALALSAIWKTFAELDGVLYNALTGSD